MVIKEIKYKSDLIKEFEKNRKEFDVGLLEKFDLTPSIIENIANTYSKKVAYNKLNNLFDNYWLDNSVDFIISILEIDSFFDNEDIYIITDGIIKSKEVPLIKIGFLNEFISEYYPLRYNEDFFQMTDIILFTSNFNKFYIIHHEEFIGTLLLK